MKIIEGLKKIKDLRRKADDLVKLVRDNCAISSLTKPVYGTEQKAKIDGWIQAHKDICKEIATLKMRIAMTNHNTMVEIELPSGKRVVNSIAYWIHRRTELATMEYQMWNALTDRGIQEGIFQQNRSSTDQDSVKVEVVRFYDPATRDNMKMDLQSEPSVIDGKLEIVNAITDLMELE